MEAEFLEHKKALIPKLRFEEYVNDWTNLPFSEMSQFINGKAYKQEELLSEGKYKVLRVGNLFSKSDWYYSDLELDENKYVDNGDLIYAWSASFGPHFWSGPKTIYHYHIWKVIPSKKTDKLFLYYTFQVDLEKIKSQSQGGTMFHITKGNIEQRKFHFPSLPEQQKIAAFLSAVDEKIQLLNRKKELLTQYKKGVMQQLFSGKLRFKDEHGKDFPEWEEKTLFDISDNVSYGMNAAAKEFDGIHKYIRITDIDINSGKYIPNPITSPEGPIDEKYRLQENDIVFARTGASVGKSYLYDKNDGQLYYAGFLIKFSIINANSFFVYSLTLREAYNKWVHVYSMRSGQPGLNAEEYKALKLKLPSLPEQIKIANYLSSIDKKTDSLSSQISQTQTFKKGLLQQMFV